MQEIVLPVVGTVEAWRRRVRDLAANGIRPENVRWSVGTMQPELFAALAPPSRPVILRLSRAAADSIATAMLHRDPARFALGHAAVVALSEGRSRWGDRSDPVIGRLIALEKAVRRAIHKMHAFVRFRELPAATEGRRRFAAWFEPEHPVAEATGPFFARRFGDMDWAIATPDVTLVFDGALRVEATATPAQAIEDATEDLWRTYFGAIFNPARLNPRLIQSEMPAVYWKNLPEAQLIPALVRGASDAVKAMHARAVSDAPPAFQARARAARDRQASRTTDGLAACAAQAATCTRCSLHGAATRTVWGEGPADARLMIVGEAPGDVEDLTGRPFMGPSGQLLDSLLSEVGAKRSEAYLTNAVKHFGYRPSGRKRLHVTPNVDQIDQCRWWLDLERRTVRPKVILALGATALRALTGEALRLTDHLGKPLALTDETFCVPSWHPAYVLRLRSDQDRAAARQAMVSHLHLALQLAG